MEWWGKRKGKLHDSFHISYRLLTALSTLFRKNYIQINITLIHYISMLFKFSQKGNNKQTNKQTKRRLYVVVGLIKVTYN